jgi:hypothetical protein
MQLESSLTDLLHSHDYKTGYNYRRKLKMVSVVNSEYVEELERGGQEEEGCWS